MSVLSASPTATRKVLAGVVALLLVSLAIVRTSDAAFSAATTNENNAFTTGQINLSADASAPLFAEANLVPGDVIANCIEITYNGSVTSADLSEVALAVDVANDADGLLADLDVAMDLTNACTDAATYGPIGPLTDLAGTTGWTPNAPNETQAFHFQVTVGPDAAQDAAADGITLTWALETTG